MSNKGWIGVDLDGTLARYDGWISEEHIGDPIPAMAERVRQWLSEGREVRIFTARVSHDRPAHFIQDWTETHFGVRLHVTNVKDFAMVELWDDRAVQIIPNTGIRADGKRD
jgi:hypothetical protein